MNIFQRTCDRKMKGHNWIITHRLLNNARDPAKYLHRDRKSRPVRIAHKLPHARWTNVQLNLILNEVSFVNGNLISWGQFFINAADADETPVQSFWGKPYKSRAEDLSYL